MKLSLRKHGAELKRNLRLIANRLLGFHYLLQPLCNDIDTIYIRVISLCAVPRYASLSNAYIDVVVLLAAYVYARGESCDLYLSKVCPTVPPIVFALPI
jgi:hypothetical protein